MVCRKCSETKSMEEFYPYRPHECKKCIGKRTAADWRRRQAVDPEADRLSRRAYHMNRKYGLSLDDIEFLLDFQGDQCAICDASEPGGVGTWHVDHDHVTEKVRGLLCFACNNRLSILENREWRERAEQYLANPPALLVFQK